MCFGTLFHASKLPLTQWFQATYRVTQNKNNLSALSLKRHLRVAYATAWRVKHKLLEAMRRRESRRLLQGVVFADDAVLGGVHSGKPGRGSENKAPFVAAVELDGNGYPQHVGFDAIDDYKGEVPVALSHVPTSDYQSRCCTSNLSPPGLPLLSIRLVR